MPRSHISPLLNPPRQESPEPDIPAPPADSCPECGVADWAWDGACWVCAGCHPEVNADDLEARRAEWLTWGLVEHFPRLPYAFQWDEYLKRDVCWAAIAAGEHHWRGFLTRADATQLDLVAAAAARFEREHQRREAA